MEESKALHVLLESSDLLGMVEELLLARERGQVSQAASSGMRLTIRNVREMIVASQIALSSNIAARRRAESAAAEEAPASQEFSNLPRSPIVRPMRAESANPNTTSATPDSNRLQMTRKDLRASLEKIIEKTS